LAGGLAQPLHRLREELLQILAELEAGLDFVEEDIEFISPAQLCARLDELSAELRVVSQQLDSRSTSPANREVALVGPPNAGKSSLFSALVARYGTKPNGNQVAMPSAITSSVRGTTRDYLSAAIHLGNAKCELIDTAGVEPEGDLTVE